MKIKIKEWLAKKEKLPKNWTQVKPERQTDKAIEVVIRNKTIWLPKSQIQIKEE